MDVYKAEKSKAYSVNKLTKSSSIRSLEMMWVLGTCPM